METNKINILYVDDEGNNLLSFKATFRMKYNVLIAISGDEALKILETSPVDIIISDQRMPNVTGTQFLEYILETFPDVIRILITGYTDIEAVTDAINKSKVFYYLTKPWNEEEMESVILKAYEAFKKNLEIKALNGKLLLSTDQLETFLKQRLLS